MSIFGWSSTWKELHLIWIFSHFIFFVVWWWLIMIHPALSVDVISGSGSRRLGVEKEWSRRSWHHLPDPLAMCAELRADADGKRGESAVNELKVCPCDASEGVCVVCVVRSGPRAPVWSRCRRRGIWSWGPMRRGVRSVKSESRCWTRRARWGKPVTDNIRGFYSQDLEINQYVEITDQ